MDRVEGFGASYIRAEGGWQFYTMPGAKEFPLFLKGYDKGRLDFVIEALNLALSSIPQPSDGSRHHQYTERNRIELSDEAIAERKPFSSWQEKD